jgi:hypothetical protein
VVHQLTSTGIGTGTGTSTGTGGTGTSIWTETGASTETGTGTGTSTETGTSTGTGTSTCTGIVTGTGTGTLGQMEFGPPDVLVNGPTQRLRSFGHLWSDFPAGVFVGANTPTSFDGIPLTVNALSYYNNSNMISLGADVVVK